MGCTSCFVPLLFLSVRYKAEGERQVLAWKGGRAAGDAPQLAPPALARQQWVQFRLQWLVSLSSCREKGYPEVQLCRSAEAWISTSGAPFIHLFTWGQNSHTQRPLSLQKPPDEGPPTLWSSDLIQTTMLGNFIWLVTWKKGWHGPG